MKVYKGAPPLGSRRVRFSSKRSSAPGELRVTPKTAKHPRRGILRRMKIVGAATVLQVTDLEVSVKFYRETLGFEEDFRYGDYAGMHLGELYLHLCAHKVWRRPVGGGAVSVVCDEVDQYCARLRMLGATIRLEPTDEPYGMRDFVVSDPDGNVLTFGCALSG
jgi:catechol 2,3-dioxygenase-like lactoylglutathione lyase family enzyme